MDRSRALLLVEDDTTTRELLGLLLAGEGWLVDDAESGEAALAWLQTTDYAPAVVLCDQRLPGLCGTPLAAAMQTVLRSRFPSHTAAFLAMTATADHAAPEGYRDLLLKPFSAASVRRLLEAAVQPERSVAPVPGVDAAGTFPSAEVELAVVSPVLKPVTPLVLDPVIHPVLDPVTLQQLRSSMPVARLAELFAFALADASNRIDRLRTFSQTNAHAGFCREAHALKGSFGVIGAEQLSTLADEAERVPAEPETFRLLSQNKVDELVSATEQLRLMLVSLFPV